MLDVHFIGQTSFRYKTDIVITQMDLLGKFSAFLNVNASVRNMCRIFFLAESLL